ncbi:MAG: Holliday junction resolvase RuvX [Thermodesulfobacteriota bacterium]
MRVLALDVGTKTIGVAVSDELQLSSNGLKTINRQSLKKDLDEIREIVDEYKPVEIVVGLPYREDGSLGKRGKDIEDLGKKIVNKFKLPVVYFDESYSTVFAEKALIEGDVSRKKRKKIIDKMAAVVILQGYLDTKS